MRRLRSGAVALLIFAIASCGSDTTAPKVQVPTALLIVAGDAQAVVVGSAVTTLPTVRLVDADGVAIAGATVTFSVGSGGGSVTGASATTDATGVAKVGGWMVGTTTGQNTLIATSGSLTATFNATSTAARAFSITPVSGKDQTATVGANVAIAPSVAVRDTFANPVAGVAVTFAIASGGGSVTGGTATSDANGIATLGSWKLGTTVGANSITASSGTLSTTISATALVGPVAEIVAVTGKDQIAPAGSKVSIPPTFVVRDAFANPVAGAVVTFSTGSSGGAITGTSATASAQGGVSVGSWTLGSQSGTYSLSAASGAATTSVTATAVAAPTDGSLRFTTVSTGLLPQGGASLHSCTLDVDGRAYCWGTNASGELGDGTTVGRTTPVPVVGPLRFSSIAIGATHTCGITVAGAAYCWGGNEMGQVGDGTFNNFRLLPTLVAGGKSFKAIGAGYGFTCGITTDGSAYCWGEGFLGRMGDGTQNNHFTPNPVSGGLSFSSIAVGFGHACALTAEGKAYCWGGGSPYYGQVGDGTAPVPNPRSQTDPLWARAMVVPTPVAGGLFFSQLAAGFATTCGVELSGKIYCWGENDAGQVGDGTTIHRGVPTLASGSSIFSSIAVGGAHTCGILQTGSVQCSGSDTAGQFGVAGTGSNTPVSAAGGMRFASLTAGQASTCGVDGSGKLYCWGANDLGQLGDGTTVSKSTPTQVIFP